MSLATSSPLVRMGDLSISLINCRKIQNRNLRLTFPHFFPPPPGGGGGLSDQNHVSYFKNTS